MTTIVETTGTVTQPVTLDKARELLKQAVDKQGRDFVYNPEGSAYCFYRPMDPVRDFVAAEDVRTKTGCVVGEALKLAGETRHLESTLNPRGILSDYPDMMTDEAANYFWTAQKVQDRGGSWGAALDEAETWANSNRRD